MKSTLGRIARLTVSVGFLLGPVAHYANAAGASGGSFGPNSPGDAAYLYRDYPTFGGALYNIDSVNSHAVVASLGIFGSGYSTTFSINGWNNGNNAVCEIFAQSLTSTWQTSAYGNTYASGYYSYNLTINLAGAPAGYYAFNAFCWIPPETSTAASYLIGIRQF